MTNGVKGWSKEVAATSVLLAVLGVLIQWIGCVRIGQDRDSLGTDPSRLSTWYGSRIWR